MTSGVPGLPVAGVVIDLVSSVAGMALVVTGIFAGALRSLAVLGEAAPERIEWMTAVGFATGVAFATLLLLLDAVLG